MLCEVLISMIFCSSMADGWPGSNWKFWSNPYSNFPNTSIINGTIFVLTFRILLTSISRFLYLLSLSVSFVLKFEPSGMAISISGQVFSFFSCRTVSGQFTNIFQFVITGTSHITVVLLTFVNLSGPVINPSAWGHLNPSSYCDVGRLFYGVFKLWSKLQRKN